MLSRYIFGCACHHLVCHWSNWSQQILSTAPLMDNHQFEQVRGSTKHYTTLVSCFHPPSCYIMVHTIIITTTIIILITTIAGGLVWANCL